MTDAVMAGARPGRWRSRLPLILLALSLALNVFFIGGVFWLKTQAMRAQMTPPERVQMVARDLSFDDKQRAAFNQFLRSARQHTRQLHDQNNPVIEHAWDELAKASPDNALLDQLTTTAAQNRQQYQVEVSEALRSFLATLSDDQRKTFVTLLRQRQNRNMPPVLRQLVQ